MTTELPTRDRLLKLLNELRRKPRTAAVAQAIDRVNKQIKSL